MTVALAPAKINLALVVGPRRQDGKHELTTVYERLELADTLTVEAIGGPTEVVGFEDDSLVAAALRALADRARPPTGWRVAIEKHIPVAAGLAGGSSDAATALRVANASLPTPLPSKDLHELAAGLGADVPFFLTSGPQLGQGEGTVLSSLRLPRSYHVVLVLPSAAVKPSTKAVYDAFDDRRGELGYQARRVRLVEALESIVEARHLARLPPNDLASSPVAAELERLGAFRADVSGAGPAVYGLFEDAAEARRAGARLGGVGRVWVTAPAWYG